MKSLPEKKSTGADSVWAPSKKIYGGFPSLVSNVVVVDVVVNAALRERER